MAEMEVLAVSTERNLHSLILKYISDFVLAQYCQTCVLSCVVVFCLVLPLTLFILVYAHIWLCSFSCSRLVHLIPPVSVFPDYVILFNLCLLIT